MSIQFSQADLKIIGKMHPEAWVEPMPSIDEIVIEFLRLHEINVKPVSSNTSPSRMTNAAMGAMGPGYLAVNTHLTQQAKAAALQEWISWKQWALSHKDFLVFKEEIRQRYFERKRKSDAFIASNREQLKIELEKFRNTQKIEQRKVLLIIASVVFGVAAVNAIASIADSFKTPDPRPQESTQSRTTSFAESASASPQQPPARTADPHLLNLDDVLKKSAASEERFNREYKKINDDYNREIAEAEQAYRRNVEAIYANTNHSLQAPSTQPEAERAGESIIQVQE